MNRVLHGVICLVATVIGVTVAFSTSPEFQEGVHDLVGFDPRIALAILMGGVGYLIGATFHYEFTRWFDETLPAIRIRDVIWGALGAIGGMIVANLVLVPLIIVVNTEQVRSALVASQLGRMVLPVILVLVPSSLNLFLGYLGSTLMLRKEPELDGLLLGMRDPGTLRLSSARRLLLDTSAIIDGRVLDLVEIGFLEGQIVVPRFVVAELQLLADSSDETRRRRGQRGLETLEALRQHNRAEMVLPERDFEDTNRVDDKLVRFAREEPCTLITNDYNLAKIAGLEGIRAVSMHALADVMRPVALPGEGLEVEIAKEGKEKEQGVGYLSDGTMVVVRDGTRYLGQRIAVVVERVLQTSAGRMIFAHPRNAEPHASLPGPGGNYPAADPPEPVPGVPVAGEDASGAPDSAPVVGSRRDPSLSPGPEPRHRSGGASRGKTPRASR